MAMAAGGGGSRSAERDDREFLVRDLIAWNSWPHQGHWLWANMSESFWIYVFKVKLCPQSGIRHDWTLCPFAHHGERARRRSPLLFAYVAAPCPNYRASQRYHRTHGTGEAPSCARGLGCGYAHGVFELWLHPNRFRTRMCNAGMSCSRRVCFFAHYPAQRRREFDPVPFFADLLAPVMFPPPDLMQCQLPLPPSSPRPRPCPRRLDDPVLVSSLPRQPYTVMQSTMSSSSEQLPLYAGGDEGAFYYYSPAAAAAAVVTPAAALIDSDSSSSVGSWLGNQLLLSLYGGDEAGAFYSPAAAVVVTPAPVDSGSSSSGASGRSNDPREDNNEDTEVVAPNFQVILDRLERLFMD